MLHSLKKLFAQLITIFFHQLNLIWVYVQKDTQSSYNVQYEFIPAFVPYTLSVQSRMILFDCYFIVNCRSCSLYLCFISLAALVCLIKKVYLLTYLNRALISTGMVTNDKTMMVSISVSSFGRETSTFIGLLFAHSLDLQ